MDQILIVNPGLSKAELVDSIKAYGSSMGLSLDEAVARLHSDAKEALAVQTGEDTTSAVSSGGKSDAGHRRYLGCSISGDFTYSFARHFGVNHGHNVLFYENCKAVHAAGAGKKVETVDKTHRLYHKNDYPAHVRRVKGATNAQRRAAGSFGYSKRGKEYNMNFAFNKKVDATHYNCSQLVWAAWKKQGFDLDRNGGPGVYPEDLWKSPKTSFVRNLSIRQP